MEAKVGRNALAKKENEGVGDRKCLAKSICQNFAEEKLVLKE